MLKERYYCIQIKLKQVMITHFMYRLQLLLIAHQIGAKYSRFCAVEYKMATESPREKTLNLIDATIFMADLVCNIASKLVDIEWLAKRVDGNKRSIAQKAHRTDMP